MNTNIHHQSVFPKTNESKPTGEAINRLLAAAVINQNFCKLLLSEPSQALKNGFQGEKFHLDHQEAELLLSIRADSLSEFATQWIKINNGKQDPKLPGGSGNWFPSKCDSVLLNAE